MISTNAFISNFLWTSNILFFDITPSWHNQPRSYDEWGLHCMAGCINLGCSRASAPSSFNKRWSPVLSGRLLAAWAQQILCGEAYSGINVKRRRDKVHQLETEVGFLMRRFADRPDRSGLDISDPTLVIGTNQRARVSDCGEVSSSQDRAQH